MYRMIYSRAVSILFAPLLCATSLLAAGANSKSLSGTVGATLEKDRNGLYLITHSTSFQLAQFSYGKHTDTVLVEGEVSHRLLVNDDIGANGDQTGRVRLTIHPIDFNGQFKPAIATRELPGDEIKLESPAGVNVITYGCCQESSLETELSLASLKTLYVRSDGTNLVTYTRLGKPTMGRLIALYLAMTPADEQILGRDQSSVALITLEGEGEVLQRIRVFLHADKPRETAMGWSAEMGWKTTSGALDNHTVIDPAKPSEPILTWKMGDNQAIELPLTNDRLEVAAAKLPADVTLKLLEH